MSWLARPRRRLCAGEAATADGALPAVLKSPARTARASTAGISWGRGASQNSCDASLKQQRCHHVASNRLAPLKHIHSSLRFVCIVSIRQCLLQHLLRRILHRCICKTEMHSLSLHSPPFVRVSFLKSRFGVCVCVWNPCYASLCILRCGSTSEAEIRQPALCPPKVRMLSRTLNPRSTHLDTYASQLNRRQSPLQSQSQWGLRRLRA
ncbi:hypothetical protein GQ54DRAFT_173365 [Martensiomyces pterosporus]|nr:hypothetical protein GQ54DRAFT_173365 [Martensiomyces pterosporus]